MNSDTWAELTEDEQLNQRLDAVMNILIIVGFTREEGVELMENLHIFSLDHLVVVTAEVINGRHFAMPSSTN